MLLFLDFFNRYVRIRARVKIKLVGDFRYGILLIFLLYNILINQLFT